MAKGSSKTMSMTGFGKAARSNANVEISVELKSVNHKYLDLTFKMPRIYSEFEFDLRSELQNNLSRGRIEILISRKVLNSNAIAINFNQPLFETYYGASSDILEHYGAWSEETRLSLVFELATNREFLTVGEDQANLAEKKLLFAALKDAVGSLVKMRAKEGANEKG